MISPATSPSGLLPASATLAQDTIRERRQVWEAWQRARRKSGITDGSGRDGEYRTVKLWDKYNPHGPQYRFHRSSARFKSVCAGRRGGKTYCAAREFLRRIFEDFAKAVAAGRSWIKPRAWHPQPKPLLHYWMVAPTYALGRLQQAELTEILERYPQLVLAWNSKCIWLVGGILIEFKSADNPLKLVGPSLSGVWIDEAARVKRDAWVDAIRPALSDRMGWALFSTTPLGRNWFWEEVWCRAEANEPGYEAFWWATADNVRVPGLAAEVEEARKTLPTAVFKRNYEASFDAYEGQILEEFSRNTHVVRPSEIPYGRIKRRFAGVDWGYSAPGSFSECGIDGDGTVWIFHEEYRRRIQVHLEGSESCWTKLAREAKNKRGSSKFWCDPSEPQYIDLMNRKAGVTALPADNSVIAGIDTLTSLIHVQSDTGRPRLYVSSDCVHHIKEFEGAHFGRDRFGHPTEKIDPSCADHAMDSSRYAVHSEAQTGGVPLVANLALIR